MVDDAIEACRVEMADLGRLRSTLIVQLREELSLSDGEIAEFLGVSRQSVHRARMRVAS